MLHPSLQIKSLSRRSIINSATLHHLIECNVIAWSWRIGNLSSPLLFVLHCKECRVFTNFICLSFVCYLLFCFCLLMFELTHLSWAVLCIYSFQSYIPLILPPYISDLYDDGKLSWELDSMFGYVIGFSSSAAPAGINRNSVRLHRSSLYRIALTADRLSYLVLSIHLIILSPVTKPRNRANLLSWLLPPTSS